MSLREDIRDFPATYGLAASWIALYAAMKVYQGGGFGVEASVLNLGGVSPQTAHLFGDLTYRDFAAGQVWRVVTATFLHLSLPHLAMNLFALIQLGQSMENWYGGRQFLTICLVLGGLGNATGTALRQFVAAGQVWLQAHGMARVLPGGLAQGVDPGAAEAIHAAGGSTVILGLIGLGMVVGWRSRTRVGAFLRDQMALFLGVTAIMGVVGYRIIDNYGHSGGAIAGIVAGFFHRILVRSSEKTWPKRVAAAFSAILIAVCLGAQGMTARTELGETRRFGQFQEAIAHANEWAEFQGDLVALAGLVEPLAHRRGSIELERRLADRPGSHATDLDLAVELERMFAPAVPVPPPPLAEAGDRIRRLLDEFARIRGRFEPELPPGDLDTALALAARVTNGPIDSRELYAFRTAWTALDRRSVAVRDAWVAKAQSLSGGVIQAKPARPAQERAAGPHA